jgi:glycosyltransferase involved in cell wall biosynthesis
MRIALVRGPSLNLYEMQNIAPLATAFSFTAFSTSYAPDWKTPPLPLNVEYCFWPDSVVAAIPPVRRLFNGLSSRLFGISFHLWGLEEKLKDFPIIHTLETHNTYSYQAARVAERYGHSLLVTVWETIPKRGESHPLRTARKQYVRNRANAFIAVTERAAQMLRTEGVPSSKIHVIPMGIDQNHFSPKPQDTALRSSWDVKPGETVWLCVARLVAEKGIEDILEAMAQGPSTWRLVIVGSGPQRAFLEKRAKKLGIQARVVFAGSFAYARMPDVYASVDALILASRPMGWWEEQFGYCLVEAMACGLPIVATRSGAIPEVIGDAGLLAIPSIPSDLARNMQLLSEGRALRHDLSELAKKRAAAEFLNVGSAQKLAALYNQLGALSKP